MHSYSNRTWLNKPESSFTGSLVCFTGKPSYTQTISENKVRDVIDFIELSDCNSKIRLHRGGLEHLSAFVDKLNTLITELTAYKIFLDSELKNSDIKEN